MRHRNLNYLNDKTNEKCIHRHILALVCTTRIVVLDVKNRWWFYLCNRVSIKARREGCDIGYNSPELGHNRSPPIFHYRSYPILTPYNIFCQNEQLWDGRRSLVSFWQKAKSQSPFRQKAVSIWQRKGALLAG